MIKKKLVDKILFYLVSFAVGALLAGAFLHILPEAIENGAEPTIKESWLRFDIALGESSTLEIGRSGVGERLGNAKVSILTPKTPNFNEALAQAHATQVEADFRLLYVNGVDFREPYTELINFETDQWVHHRTVIPLRTFIGE